MEIIDPFWLYVILQLDSIKGLFFVFAVIFGLASIVVVPATLGVAFDCHSEKKDRVIFSLVSAAPIAAVFFCATVSALLPSTERAAIVAVLPAIANSHEVQGEARELYEIAKQGLDRIVRGKAEEPAE